MLKLELPVVETERLRLRPVEETDANAFNEFTMDPIATFFVGYATHTSLADTEKQMRENFMKKIEKGFPESYSIVLKESGKVIGVCDVHTVSRGDSGEIGYILNPAYQGKGYMREAIKKLIEISFQHTGLRRLTALVSTKNLASQAVVESCGFRTEGLLKEAFVAKDDTYHDFIAYGLLSKEYKGDE